jgi:acetolactate synthase small subunit
MSLPEIRVMQLCYPHGYTGNMVEEEVVAMKATLDQKFYGDARSHLNIMRYEIHDLSEGHARASLLALVENIENALSLRANLDLTEL